MISQGELVSALEGYIGVLLSKLIEVQKSVDSIDNYLGIVKLKAEIAQGVFGVLPRVFVVPDHTLSCPPYVVIKVEVKCSVDEADNMVDGYNNRVDELVEDNDYEIVLRVDYIK